MVTKRFEHQNSHFGLSAERRLTGLFLFGFVSLGALSFALLRVGKSIQITTGIILENRDIVRTTKDILHRLSEFVNISREYAALGESASLEVEKQYAFFPASLKKTAGLYAKQSGN